MDQRIEKDKVIEMSNGSIAKLLTIDENGVAVVEKNNEKVFLSPIEYFNEMKVLKLKWNMLKLLGLINLI